MPLTIGARLGPYEIVGAIGAGGMGEVYRARDTRLERTVAIKILPEALAADPQFRERFEREAKTISQLAHPHICRLFDVGRHDGVDFLVLEYLEGETLAERLGRANARPLQLREALVIAVEIADALAAAHRAGIVHRDLKPGNVMLTKSGARLLDFGLAKSAPALGPAKGGHYASALTAPPTMTTPLTTAGSILGTFQYMAPEQLEGGDADARSDIFAFGALLYEMLTGSKAFAGKSQVSVMAAILDHDPPPPSTIAAATPPSLDRVVKKCLEKDPDRRWQSARDLASELEWIGDLASKGSPTSMQPEATLRKTSTRALPWVVAAVAGATALVAIALWAPWRTAPPRTALRLTADFGADVSLAANGAPTLALSPDGSTLAFVGQTPTGEPQLHVRALNQLSAARLEGTDGAAAPFFSPDSQWIAYFASGKLNKIPVHGGAAITLCDAATPRGGAWADNGTIVFAPASTGTLFRVSASGGKAEPATKLAPGEVTHRWPQVLDDTSVLFTASASNGQYEDASLLVQQLPDGPRKVVARGGYYGRYLSSGHLVYIHAATLFAVPFDLGRLEVAGPAVPAAQGISAIAGTGAAQFAVSADGTLVYAAGEGEDINAPLVWLDGHGKTTPLRTTRSNWGNPRFAPDGRRLAMNITASQRQLFVYEWAKDTLSQLTFDPLAGADPVWSPDGRDIVFSGKRPSDPALSLYVRHADGSGDAVRLTNSPNNQVPTSWHPSGKFLAYSELANGSDLMILPIDGSSASGWKAGKPEVLLANAWPELDAAFSPDGRWVAYSSGQSGRPEIFVQPFPATGGRWKVSAETGGRYPVWSRAGHEIIFEALNGSRLMAAAYSVEGMSFRPEKPRIWAEGRFARLNGQRGFDLHPDEDRVVVAGGRQAEGESKQNQAVFVFNFFDELHRMAPASKR